MDLCEQPLPDPLLEVAQVGRLPDEGGAVELPGDGENMGVRALEVGEECLVLMQRYVLPDALHGDDLAVGELGRRAPPVGDVDRPAG